MKKLNIIERHKSERVLVAVIEYKMNPSDDWTSKQIEEEMKDVEANNSVSAEHPQPR